MEQIGICITTKGRDRYLSRSIENHLKHLPQNAKIIVVDDGSDDPKELENVEYFHFVENVGIPKAKNKCLELAQDCEHIFLFDDDIYPIVDNWHVSYIESPEAHLSYCWSDNATYAPGEKGGDVKLIKTLTLDKA